MTRRRRGPYRRCFRLLIAQLASSLASSDQDKLDTRVVKRDRDCPPDQQSPVRIDTRKSPVDLTVPNRTLINGTVYTRSVMARSKFPTRSLPKKPLSRAIAWYSRPRLWLPTSSPILLFRESTPARQQAVYRCRSISFQAKVRAHQPPSTPLQHRLAP